MHEALGSFALTLCLQARLADRDAEVRSDGSKENVGSDEGEE